MNFVWDDSSDSSMHVDINRVPPPRSVCMRQVLRDPVKNWRGIDEYYKNDKTFIIDVLTQATELPSKADFERLFPQSLRFDRDIVLAFCQRDDFEKLYQDRHLYVPYTLTNDAEVMKHYVRKIQRALQSCSEELMDDPDVVRIAVLRDGLELQYASRRLQEDEAMLRLACSNDGRALDFCPLGDVRHRLLSDREFMKTVVSNKGGIMMRQVHESLRYDQELLHLALGSGLEFRYVPAELQSDPQFCEEAVAVKSEIYYQLDKKLQLLEPIAEAAVTAPDSTAGLMDNIAKQVKIFQHQNRRIAMAVAARGDVSFMREHMANYLNDRDVMRVAVARAGDLFNSLSPDLREDIEIVNAALSGTTAANVLRSLSMTWKAAHPDVCIRAIQVTHLLRETCNAIPARLWQNNRELQLAWIRRGCRVLGIFQNQIDAAMGLEIAEHAWRDFEQVPLRLRNDLEFMKQAITVNGRVIKFAVAPIKSDYDLAVRAIASYAHSEISMSRVLVQRFVEEKLVLYDNFVHEFLRGIAAGGEQCPLSMLSVDRETGSFLKQNIADFLGVPVASLLGIYRQCLENFMNPPQTILGSDPLPRDLNLIFQHLREAGHEIPNETNGPPPLPLPRPLPHDDDARAGRRRALLRMRMNLGAGDHPNPDVLFRDDEEDDFLEFFMHGFGRDDVPFADRLRRGPQP